MNTTYHNTNRYLIENLIISIANKKHNDRVACHCKEHEYRTICVSLDEIKQKCIELNIKYPDIEYLFYYTYTKSGFLCLCKSQEELILKFLKKRIKYELFGKNRRKANSVYISTHDDFYIVFALKNHKI
jgi:hypothetical protein